MGGGDLSVMGPMLFCFIMICRFVVCVCVCVWCVCVCVCVCKIPVVYISLYCLDLFDLSAGWLDLLQKETYMSYVEPLCHNRPV